MLVAATTPLDEEKESNFLRGEQDLFQGIREKELHGSVKPYLFLLVGGHSVLLNPVETLKMNSETQQASKTIGPIPYDWKTSFPWTGVSDISLRDYFAGQALAGFLAAPMGKFLHQDGIHVITRDCYDVADAMLVSRERKGGAA